VLFSLLISALPVTVAETAVPAPIPILLTDEEFDRRYAAAKKDAKKLWSLVLWCEDTDREKSARKALRALIRLEPNHAEARKRLGHIRYDKRWFTTEKKLAEYKAQQAAERARELGLVEFQGEWVSPKDLPYLKKGLVKDPDGVWVDPEDLRRAEEGWLRQDLVWVAPEDAPKMEQGLWKCGDVWMSLDEAERYHSRVDRCWEIPGIGFVLRTTCSREVAGKAMAQMERAYRDMERIYGRRPIRPVPVFLADTKDQLGTVCAEATRQRQPVDGRRLIESMKVVFAESWLHPEDKSWIGAGAAWWDPKEEHGDAYGVHQARMALGLSYADAMDPSPNAVASVEGRAVNARFTDAFYREKKIPAWFSWGAACYASRYYIDIVGTGGNPHWTREWSVENLKLAGGLPNLATVFQLPLGTQNRDSDRLVLAAGLLVAFILDGGCEPLSKIHGELKAAFQAGEDPGKIFNALRMEILRHETELRAFAQL